MRNIRLTIAYDGTKYCGWQIQPNGTSVQSVVEAAAKKLTFESVNVLASGRTDSGVHALGQVAHFHTNSTIPCGKLRSGLQRFLPDDIVVRSAEEVPADFHARYHALRKRYRYVIYNSRVPIPFLQRYAYTIGKRLDAVAMHAAAQSLVGTHDFRSFESHFPNRSSSVRTVMELEVTRRVGWDLWSPTPGTVADDGEFIVIDIMADGFLYNMVRSITGTLLKVGYGNWPVDKVGIILENQTRDHAGATAPPHGLYLVHVDYDGAESVPHSTDKPL
jgi:tRNA pseudouridine38-40 synthase